MLISGEYTVGELAIACDIPPHMASEHLTKMKDRGLLESTRRGRCNYYSVLEPGLEGILKCIDARFGSRKEVMPRLPARKTEFTRK